MNNLSNTILDYYWAHFDELPFEKQFHFASRLYLWNQDPVAKQKLAELRPIFTANDQPDSALHDVITLARNSSSHGSKNAAELRRPYFEKYPQLKAYVSGLFRLTFLQNIYSYDVRTVFFDEFPETDVRSFARELAADREAIAILSTHAINFLYLCSRVLCDESSAIAPEDFITIGRKQYDFSNPLHLQLYIYLYTHCIIGESQFYYRAIGQPAPYLTMLTELEATIAQHYDSINLDNKFEFLVCCRQLGYASSLQDQIYQEAEISVSELGSFLIDRHNGNPQTSNVTLDLSEHRNVLFIMSHSAYRPLGR